MLTRYRFIYLYIAFILLLFALPYLAHNLTGGVISFPTLSNSERSDVVGEFSYIALHALIFAPVLEEIIYRSWLLPPAKDITSSKKKFMLTAKLYWGLVLLERWQNEPFVYPFVDLEGDNSYAQAGDLLFPSFIQPLIVQIQNAIGYSLPDHWFEVYVALANYTDYLLAGLLLSPLLGLLYYFKSYRMWYSRNFYYFCIVCANLFFIFLHPGFPLVNLLYGESFNFQELIRGIGLVGFSIFATYARIKYSLVAAILVHFLWNATQIIFLFVRNDFEQYDFKVYWLAVTSMAILVAIVWLLKILQKVPTDSVRTSKYQIT